MKDALSSEHLDDGARPVFSKQQEARNVFFQQFVPEYIREKFDQSIEPNRCSIKAFCKAGKKDVSYTFIMSWYKNDEYTDISGGSSDRTMMKSAESSASGTSKIESQRQQQQQHRTMQNLETSVEIIPSSEQIHRCDGPCGKVRPIKDLQIHGQCDHVICRYCTRNAPTIKNIDGSRGCCNPVCFAINLAAKCPDPVLRHKYFQNIICKEKIDEIIGQCNKNSNQTMKQKSSSPSSSSSVPRSDNKSGKMKQRILKELLCVELLIIWKGPMETICRRRSISEIDPSRSLRRMLQWMIGNEHNLQKCRIFVKYMDDGNLKFQEINLKEHGDKKITTFPTIDGIVYFVVDYANFTRGTSSPPRF